MFEAFDGEDSEGWGGGFGGEVSQRDVISTLRSLCLPRLWDRFWSFDISVMQ